MYMRLGFSIAINVDPDILLIDEVLSVGDASFVPKCLDRINEFRRLGKTIVFVSHDLNTVERICDEVIWLRNGVIQMCGYPKRTVDAYLEYIGKKDLEATRQKHEDESQAAASGREQRWGGKEIEISNVRMYSAAGEEKYVFQAGESATVAFGVLARQPESDFVFGLAIYGGDGVLCYGSNTQIEEFRSETISGSGRVRITIPALNLGNGTYFLDLAAHKRDGYPFDYHHFLYSFRVNSLSRELGMLRLPHTWEFSENIRWKRQ
jgi:ABC-2 type transport system ATP-binding protein/lipopolysaccharide transport system ATP-binding protein